MLTPGQACDLDGSDALLPDLKASKATEASIILRQEIDSLAKKQNIDLEVVKAAVLVATGNFIQPVKPPSVQPAPPDAARKRLFQVIGANPRP
jgi:hypothetical protein